MGSFTISECSNGVLRMLLGQDDLRMCKMGAMPLTSKTYVLTSMTSTGPPDGLR